MSENHSVQEDTAKSCELYVPVMYSTLRDLQGGGAAYRASDEELNEALTRRYEA